MSAHLKQQRMNASLHSKGESSNHIHLGIIKMLEMLPSLKVESKLSIADIGCGTGILLHRMHQKFPQAELTGMDLTYFIEEKKSWLHFEKCDLNTQFGSKDMQFDLVTSSEVIEHLENPRHFLRECLQLLKPEGYLVLSTPNIESYTSVLSFIFRGYHSAFGPKNYPAHITALSLYDLSNMVNETETAKLVNHYYIPNGRVPKMRVLWKSILPFAQGKRFSDNFVVVIQKFSNTDRQQQ